jgi:hypothetical protein
MGSPSEYLSAVSASIDRLTTDGCNAACLTSAEVTTFLRITCGSCRADRKTRDGSSYADQANAPQIESLRAWSFTHGECTGGNDRRRLLSLGSIACAQVGGSNGYLYCWLFCVSAGKWFHSSKRGNESTNCCKCECSFPASNGYCNLGSAATASKYN